MKHFNKSNYQTIENKIFNSISNKLKSIDEDVSLEYLFWLDRKTTLFQNTFYKSGYGTQPDDLARGDIIYVEFGINVGTELSDFKTKGHYAIVWSIDLGNVVVIPLSSRDALGSDMTFDLGVIPELNIHNDKDTHSYLKLDAIRSISKRRISRIVGIEKGKITLSEDIIDKIKDAIRWSFLS